MKTKIGVWGWGLGAALGLGRGCEVEWIGGGREVCWRASGGGGEGAGVALRGWE